MKIQKDGYGKMENAVEYWTAHRAKLSDLYPSERHFFEPMMKGSLSTLDIGCAAGGSALFSREVNPELAYVGIDVSQDLIDGAQLRLGHLPNTEFISFDGHSLPFEDRRFDSVFSFGVFHHLNHWKELAVESLRVSSKYVLFDLRLWSKETLMDSSVSYQKLSLAGEWDQKSIMPYNVISMNDFLAFAHQLKQNGVSCKGFGYYRPPTDLAVTPAKEVLMLSVLLEKNQSNLNHTASIELNLI